MAKTSFSYKVFVVESVQEITNRILKATERGLRDVFTVAEQEIRRRISVTLVAAIKAQPEYTSLLSGKLRVDFGLAEPAGLIEEIIAHWANSIEFERKKVRVRGTSIVGGFTLKIIPDFHREVIALYGKYVSSRSGEEIPWLKWLLLEGDKVLVADWRVKYGAYPNSRTQEAIMVQRGAFRVDSQFSGTRDNNWVTRALDSVNRKIEQIIMEEITLALEST